MIYAFDFDGTLAETNYPEILRPIGKVIEFAKEKKDKGHKIILWTCRCGEELENAVSWCKSYGLIFDAINDNLTELKEAYKNNTRKIYADFYIDDHNLII